MTPAWLLPSISQMAATAERFISLATETTTGGLELRFLRLGTVSVMVFLVINTGAISIAQDGAGRWVVDAKFGRALPSGPVPRRLGTSRWRRRQLLCLPSATRAASLPALQTSPPALRTCVSGQLTQAPTLRDIYALIWITCCYSINDNHVFMLYRYRFTRQMTSNISFNFNMIKIFISNSQ